MFSRDRYATCRFRLHGAEHSPMTPTETTFPKRAFGATMRRDTWWIQPLLVFLGLGTFVVYSTWAALQGEHYFSGPYLSPFYSPEIFGHSPHSLLGPKPGWWPGWLPFSPALLVLWAPGLFRLTCYYYRGAYYKSFWADPPACAVGEPRKLYLGEQSFPLIMQNVHRYFLYLALISPASSRTRRLEGDVVRGSAFGISVAFRTIAARGVNVCCSGGYFGCRPAACTVSGVFSMSRRGHHRSAHKAEDYVSCLNGGHGGACVQPSPSVFRGRLRCGCA